MKNCRGFVVVALAAAFLFIWPHQSTMSDTAQFVNNEIVFADVIVEIEIYGLGMEIYTMSGTWEISWSDPVEAPDGHIEIETEIVSMDLAGPGIIFGNSGLPSPGGVRSIDPGIDFPAESFFDVYAEIEIPDKMPGVTLHNAVPDYIVGFVDDFPSYFDPYNNPAPLPETPLLDEFGVEVGMMRIIHVEMIPYYPPEAHIIVERMKGSDILVPYEENADLFRVQAEVSGPYEVTDVVFDYRLMGSPDPWTPFANDGDGSAESWSTIEDKGSGDGWSGYLDRWTFPSEGEWYELRVTANTVRNGPVSGIGAPVFIDPYPPFPEFVEIDPDSVVYAKPGNLVILFIRLLRYFVLPPPVRVQVFPLGVDFKRPLTPVNQLAMGPDTTLNEKSCGPAAAASCLKYFADNGYPELDNPGGDTAKPNQTGEQMAGELGTAMGTNTTIGTTAAGMVAGIKSYLDSHGQSGWTVEHKKVDEYFDIGEMFDEFEADGEDVMMIVENVLPNGDTVQHCVTLGSKGSTVYETEQGPIQSMHVAYSLDFMDPWGGEGTENNEYAVSHDDDGKPTLVGYKVDSTATSDARIAGYVKVSPPDSSGGGSRLAIPAAADPGWIEVAAGVLQGNGVIDTFYWDATGFPGGLYLLEVVSETPDGQTCRDLRLAGIPEYTVDAEPPTPESPTKLIGSYPNPFNPMTTIEFYVARDTEVDITIYDAAGRTVRRLVRSRQFQNGTHQVRWNGINDSGVRVSSGVYFFRFAADGQEFSSKLVLLR